MSEILYDGVPVTQQDFNQVHELLGAADKEIASLREKNLALALAVKYFQKTVSMTIQFLPAHTRSEVEDIIKLLSRPAATAKQIVADHDREVRSDVWREAAEELRAGIQKGWHPFNIATDFKNYSEYEATAQKEGE